MSKQFWNSEKIVSMAAMFISICTLFTIIYQTTIFREQQYASVYPRLEIWNNGGNDNYKFTMVNTGIGPAFIEEVRIIHADTIFEGDPASFAELFMKTLDRDSIENINYGYSNMPKGRLIRPGQNVSLITTNQSKKSTQFFRRLFGNQTAKLEVVYSSVYGERWKLTGMSFNPEKLE